MSTVFNKIFNHTPPSLLEKIHLFLITGFFCINQCWNKRTKRIAVRIFSFTSKIHWNQSRSFYTDILSCVQVVLPTAPRAALGTAVDDSRIPWSPPFTAYVANLPYDVDEDQIKDVFVKCKLKVSYCFLSFSSNY